MTELDDDLHSATADLRRQVAGMSVPEYRVDRNRPGTIRRARVLAAAVVIGLLAAGVVLVQSDPGGVITGNRADMAGPTEVTDGELDVTTDPVESTEPTGGQTQQLTSATSGEYLVPLPFGSAWNADETHLLLYRTGSSSPAYLVIDVATGEQIGEAVVDPPDIEQVYWHPTNPDLLVFAAGNELRSWSVNERRESTLHRFVGCDRVDSGSTPVPPSSGGLMGLLCYADGDTFMLAFELDTGREIRVITDGREAPRPAPSGTRFAVGASDGSVGILDADLDPTGVSIDLEGDQFVVVGDGAGGEYLAAAQYQGDEIGSLVLHPIDGTPARVIVGPSSGDEYPPSGTWLSASTNSSSVALTIRGVDDDRTNASALAGKVLVFDSGDRSGQPRFVADHGGAARHEYWSTNFVSLSPSGRWLIWSSDGRSDRVETFIVELPE